MWNNLKRCITATSLIGLVFGAIAASSSPSAGTDLICHTSNPAECYPRIFQPTADFQEIHEDQNLPPGLHIRMNIYTGLKEGRLNIPSSDDTGTPELSSEHAVVVVPTESEVIIDDSPALRDRVPQKPPAYDNAGRIQPPKEYDGESGESEAFEHAISVLGERTQSSGDDLVESALAVLQDLSHDIYYGVELLKRPTVLQALTALLTDDSSSGSSSASRRRYAASVLSNALQNNPSALREAGKSWMELMPPLCGSDSKESKDASICEKDELINKISQNLNSENDPSAMKAKLNALNGLIKDQDNRDKFLANNGMELLLSIFIKEGAHWDAARMKIAQLAMDSFLDEDMGAELGVWPLQSASSREQCRQAEQEAGDGCWEYHLEKMAAGDGGNGNGDGKWAADFLSLIRRNRPGGSGQQTGSSGSSGIPAHNEL